MQKVVLNKWIKALRSGVFPQSEHGINVNNGSYDSFGVLFQIIANEKDRPGIRIRWDKNNRHNYMDVMFQKERNLSYVYGGTFVPTKALVDLLEINEEVALEISDLPHIAAADFLEKHLT